MKPEIRRKAVTHLVGSVPLEDAAAVFTQVSAQLGERITRLPDGETGSRSNWIKWQFPVLSSCPELEVVQTSESEAGPPQIRLRDGVAATDIRLGELGYSKAAIASFAEFSKQKEAGQIPQDCRFQISLPTPLAPIQFYIAKELRPVFEPIYEARMLEELREIVAAIPNDELAIQWDTAVEFGVLEGTFASHLDDPLADILERLVRLGNAVPDSVELGYHLCYGDSNHRHFVEPADAGHLAAVANGLVDAIDRTLHWIHMPVPRDRFDDAFYEPLASLNLPIETELFLGLIHVTDAEEGTQRRIDVAKKFVSDFGVATECGFGRRPSDAIPGLLDLHAHVADTLGAG